MPFWKYSVKCGLTSEVLRDNLDTILTLIVAQHRKSDLGSLAVITLHFHHGGEGRGPTHSRRAFMLDYGTAPATSTARPTSPDATAEPWAIPPCKCFTRSFSTF
jgi:hypothetical protein